jgi:hypothetical protein
MDFSPADFQDADEVRPSDSYFDFGSAINTAAPVSFLMNNILQRHIYEVKEGARAYPTQTQWRRRFREFILLQENDLLKFAAKPLQSHPVLGPTELLLRRFGRGNFQPTHTSLRDLVLDVSAVNLTDIFNDSVKQFELSLKGFHEMTKFFMEKYRESAAEIARVSSNMQAKLELFDSIQKKVQGLADLQTNEFSTELAETTEKYLGSIFKENGIEALYWELIEAYRVFFTLRDIVHLRRYADTTVSEPLCSICFTDPIQYTLNPCGHTFCTTCVKKQMTQCYVCRQNVKDRVKLFIC